MENKKLQKLINKRIELKKLGGWRSQCCDNYSGVRFHIGWFWFTNLDAKKKQIKSFNWKINRIIFKYFLCKKYILFWPSFSAKSNIWIKLVSFVLSYSIVKHWIKYISWCCFQMSAELLPKFGMSWERSLHIPKTR